ncbi:MAG: hypothetical protein ABIQ44_10735 [Chloroflexia bacterium]
MPVGKEGADWNVTPPIKLPLSSVSTWKGSPITPPSGGVMKTPTSS